MNLAASVSYSGGSAHSVSYGHDANGNETSMSDATGSSSYIYDPFGELTSATNGAGQVTGYGYNPDGRANGITYPLPGAHSWAATTTVSYGYDNTDVLTSVTDFNNHQIAITPNADGLSATVSLGATGDTINTTYDNTDTPAAVTLKNTSSTLQSFTYSDAPSGNILNETDTPSSSQTPAVYTYDAKGRVTSMTPGTGSPLNYTFDASSDLTTLPAGASTSYDKAGELTSATLSSTATSYSYNADGERLSEVQGGSTIASGTWNGAAQLTSYNDPAGNMTAASYDGNGLRVTATSGTGGQSFVWNDVSPIPQVIMDTGNAYIYTDGVAPAEQVNLSTGAISYLVTDSLGSVRGVVSGSGTLTATTSYDAWGNPETAGGLSATTPFGYAGGYTDPDGLIYLLARYYDPSTGQFLSVDPALAQTAEPYEYANGNPLSNVDPSGERSINFRPSWHGLNVFFDRNWTLGIALFGTWALTGVVSAVKAFVSWVFYDELADAVAEWIKDRFMGGIEEAVDIIKNHPQQCLMMSIQWFPWPTVRWNSYKFPKAYCQARSAIRR